MGKESHQPAINSCPSGQVKGKESWEQEKKQAYIEEGKQQPARRVLTRGILTGMESGSQRLGRGGGGSRDAQCRRDLCYCVL